MLGVRQAHKAILACPLHEVQIALAVVFALVVARCDLAAALVLAAGEAAVAEDVDNQQPQLLI